ncbi:MAG: MarR family transcriptional regulator [Hyphomicrobiales bacterium]|nr:MAG: MarR family transcriptional regulator [Hyphomicrobiales bacterium]
MTKADQNRDLAFTLSDVARLLRTCADQKVAQFGVTRAKWAVLARLERFEGLKQSELAEMLDLQPITLTRLLDGLCESGLIERRADAEDRRAKRLYLTPAARPLLKRLGKAGNELIEAAFDGLSDAETARLLSKLLAIKDNLRRAARRKETEAEVRYG